LPAITMPSLFPPVDPDGPADAGPRRRLTPSAAVLPNLITLLALCAGLTAIRMAIEHRYDLAFAAILFAAVLDGIDGRMARYLRATSRFGAELDSLADFVDFGVAPAFLLYVWALDGLGSIGWICALVLAICTGLRLARFNSALPMPSPEWQKDFFVGVPAPAGALVVLLPLYLDRMGVPIPAQATGAVALYTLAIAFLMVSRLPSLSGKRFGRRIPRDGVLPVLVVGVLLVALLASYPFTFMAVGVVLYLLHLPMAWRLWERASTAHAAPASPPL
jgi:CDP-diacylglycerol--serine O-phosphatidyltransferase